MFTIFSQFRLCFQGKRKKTIPFVLFLMITFSGAAEASESGKLVISKKEIQKMNVQNIPELLSRFPGIEASESSVTIRGSTEVKVFLNGMPITDPTSPHGGIKWDMVSLEEVESITVYKGGTAEYSENSSGGAILIATGKTKGVHGNIKAFGGNLQTQNYKLNLESRNGTYIAGINSGYESTNGYRSNDDEEKWHVGGKLGFRFHQDNKILVSGKYLNEEKGLAGLPEYPTPELRKAKEMYSIHLIEDLGILTGKTYFQDAEKEYDDPSRNLHTHLRVQILEQKISGKTWQGNWGKLDWGGGVSWSGAQGTGISNPKESAYWLFASDNFTLPQIPVNFTLRIRSNFYSDFQNCLNPQVKASFSSGKWTAAFSAVRICNTPTFTQRYKQSAYRKPNPDLAPEKVNNFSLSFSWKPVSGLSFATSVFYKQLTDRITYVRRKGGFKSYQNVGEAIYKGLENSFDWQIIPELSLAASYTYLKAINKETDNWLPFKAKHTGKADIKFEPLDYLSFVLHLEATSKKYIRPDESESVPGYCLADLRAKYDWKDIELFAKVENLTDKEYSYGMGYPAPPRTWITGINYVF